MDADYLAALKAFIKDEVLGKEWELTRPAERPSPMHNKFYAAGLGNWWVSKELGGRGFSVEDGVEIMAHLAYGDCGLAATALTSVLGSRIIELYASDALKKKFLAPMMKNHGIAALAGSELGCGSELMRMSTTARREGSKMVIDGNKGFSSSAAFADFVLVIAAAPEEDSGYVAVVVPKGTPGMRVVKRWETVGVQSSCVYNLQFENCQVPVEHLLEGNGLRMLEVGLNPSRIMIAACGIGIGRRVIDVCLDYAKTKTLQGGLLVDNAVFASKLGQMEMEVEAITALCKTAAREYDALYDSPNGKQALFRKGVLKSAIVAKLASGQLCANIASVGSQMLGGFGYTTESIVGKLLCDASYIPIVEGGADVAQGLLYSRHVKDRPPFI